MAVVGERAVHLLDATAEPAHVQSNSTNAFYLPPRKVKGVGIGAHEYTFHAVPVVVRDSGHDTQSSSVYLTSS